MLSQIQNGQEKVIAYGSRPLSKSESNFCVTDKELLAIRYYVEYFRHYLLGRKFTVRSDHKALHWLFSMKNPNGRIARWIEVLSSYSFSVEYRKGSKHGYADSLSRCPNPQDCSCDNFNSEEDLKCGPCKKCKQRAINCKLDFSRKTQSVKRIHKMYGLRTEYFRSIISTLYTKIFLICTMFIVCSNKNTFSKLAKCNVTNKSSLLNLMMIPNSSTMKTSIYWTTEMYTSWRKFKLKHCVKSRYNTGGKVWNDLQKEVVNFCSNRTSGNSRGWSKG